MARGLPTPMAVILAGVICGTLAGGLIGLFVGPVVLVGLLRPAGRLDRGRQEDRGGRRLGPVALTSRPASRPAGSGIVSVGVHMVRLVLKLLCGLGLAVSALSGGGASAQTADGARVYLVLDASGSMWGRVGNQTKIEVARETIRSLLKDWRPDDQLGLVTYGHRRKGDCGDIEILKPVGKVDAAALMAQVNGISPKGMTPMTASVKTAAEQLKASEGVTSVILVSDGVETCKADPCSVAAELKKADVKLVVHTVGFDIQDRQAVKQLECMAAATGGLALSASNAGELGYGDRQGRRSFAREDAASRRRRPHRRRPNPGPTGTSKARRGWPRATIRSRARIS